MIPSIPIFNAVISDNNVGITGPVSSDDADAFPYSFPLTLAANVYVFPLTFPLTLAENE